MCPPSILRCCRVYRDFLDVGYVCLSVSIYKVIVFSFVFNHGVWKELEKMSSLVHKNVKFVFFFWVWQVVLVRKMGFKFWVLFGLDLSTGICLFWVIVCIKMQFLFFFFFFCLIAVKYRRRETKYWICVCFIGPENGNWSQRYFAYEGVELKDSRPVFCAVNCWPFWCSTCKNFWFLYVIKRKHILFC